MKGQTQAASKYKAIELLSNVNIRFVASIFDENRNKTIEQGFISYHGVLPSDLSIDLDTNTELRNLKTKAAIIISVSANRPVFNPFLMKSLSILVHPEADPGAKVLHQYKVTGEEELKIRFKVWEEGVYMVSVRLYNHHISQSPILLPVLDDPAQCLAKLGLVVLNSVKINTPIQSVISEQGSSIKVKGFSKSDQNEKLFPLPEVIKEPCFREDTRHRMVSSTKKSMVKNVSGGFVGVSPSPLKHSARNVKQVEELEEELKRVRLEEKAQDKSDLTRNNYQHQHRDQVSDSATETGQELPHPEGVASDPSDAVAEIKRKIEEELKEDHNAGLEFPIDILENRLNFSAYLPTDILIVVHIPKNMDDNSLNNLFSVVAPVKTVAIGRDDKSGNHLGYGLVRFYHPNDADKAVRIMNHFPVSYDKNLNVSYYYHGITKINRFDRTNLLIQNIPVGTAEEDLFRHFAQYGCLVSCKLMTPGDHAYVRYASVASAMSAVAESDGLQLGNSSRDKLIVRFKTLIQIY